MMGLRSLALIAVMIAEASSLVAQTLPPFKDAAFGYPPTIAADANGDDRLVAYDPRRDTRLDGASGGRSPPQSAALGVRRVQRDLVVRTAAGDVRVVAVGRQERASLIVVWLHGQGGTRQQGVDDFAASGNFNRIKNLVVAAGGLYLSPDFSDFGARGTAEVAALVAVMASGSPRAPVFFACGSAGGAICWGVAHDAALAPRLAGLMLLGSFPDEGFLASEAFRRRVPLLLAQGMEDRIFPVEGTAALFRTIRTADTTYPVKLVRFEQGRHGTPVRMTDWRETINWMLSVR